MGTSGMGPLGWELLVLETPVFLVALAYFGWRRSSTNLRAGRRALSNPCLGKKKCISSIFSALSLWAPGRVLGCAGRVLDLMAREPKSLQQRDGWLWGRMGSA